MIRINRKDCLIGPLISTNVWNQKTWTVSMKIRTVLPNFYKMVSSLQQSSNAYSQLVSVIIALCIYGTEKKGYRYCYMVALIILCIVYAVLPRTLFSWTEYVLSGLLCSSKACRCATKLVQAKVVSAIGVLSCYCLSLKSIWVRLSTTAVVCRSTVVYFIFLFYN